MCLAGGSVVSPCCCQLSDNRESLRPEQQHARKSRVSCNRILMLFVFLEAAGAGKGVGHCTTNHWGQQMDCVHELRGMLDGLLHSQQKKFKQATHSVLNKLLCNYGTHIKVNAEVSVSIHVCLEPVIHGALCGYDGPFKRIIIATYGRVCLSKGY